MDRVFEIRLDALDGKIERLRRDFDALNERLQKEKVRQELKESQRRDRILNVLAVVATIVVWVVAQCLVTFAPE